MKKIAICLMATGLLLTFQPLQSKAEPTVPNSVVVATKPDNESSEAENKALILRLEEIKEMDHSQLNLREKRALRKEVRAIQNQMQQSGGLYISVGALIIIILLIILIF